MAPCQRPYAPPHPEGHIEPKCHIDYQGHIDFQWPYRTPMAIWTSNGHMNLQWPYGPPMAIWTLAGNHCTELLFSSFSFCFWLHCMAFAVLFFFKFIFSKCYVEWGDETFVFLKLWEEGNSYQKSIYSFICWLNFMFVIYFSKLTKINDIIIPGKKLKKKKN